MSAAAVNEPVPARADATAEAVAAAAADGGGDAAAAAATTTTATHAEGSTWFAQLCNLITKVKLDEEGRIPTEPFLAVAERFPEMFDIVFGEGRVSARLRADVGGNVESLQTIYKHNPAAYQTLDQTPEMAAGIEGRVKLLWLQRGLLWIFRLIEDLLARPDEEVATIAWASYEKTLGRHHNWFVRKFVGVVFSVAPARADLLAAFNTNEETFRRQGVVFVKNFAPLMVLVQAWLVDNKLEEPEPTS